MKRKLKLVKWVLAIALLLTSIIPVRIAIAFYQTPVPQAIFVLGGAPERMKFAAQFWQSRQSLDIWVSDFPWNLDANRRIFLRFGVPDAKLHLDGRATDTVTNFTTLAGDFADQRLQHIYLITSDYHMRRAQAIATIVLGSQGIAVTTIAVASQNQPSESMIRVLRDCGRSFLWIVAGRTGASFNSRLKSHRNF
ncbi:YdcF family protein [Nostoc sphaeroides]|uniref:YdcF family protein n=1 Tax=Nostoc sphaeroides CCNUC1 TaxID=2653204 RepID=A0A5P8VSF9_9NOSO|nr:YdcF family protein [Nostoc sphaeroides]QFS43251.1 YdcF family protein [Nostoc sphaeroides CCNUC1]